MGALEIITSTEVDSYLQAACGVRLLRDTRRFQCVSCGASVELPGEPLTIGAVKDYLNRHAPCSCHVKQSHQTVRDLINEMERVTDRMTAAPWTVKARSANHPDPLSHDPADFLQFEVRGPAPVDGRGDFVGVDAYGICWLRNNAAAILEAMRKDGDHDGIRGERGRRRRYLP